jgi:hypothetical protein
VRRSHGFVGRGRLTAVPGTAILWHGLGGWLDALEALARRARPSARHYARADALYRSLRIEDVRGCTCAAVLARAEAVFGQLRRDWSAPILTRPPRDLGRGHFGQLLVEARNQRLRLAQGREDGPRRRNRRFEPGRIPDDRLLVLLQRLPAGDVRDALETERRRRGL